MSVQWTGLREFEEELRTLPQTLADYSEDSVREATESTYAQLVAVYPVSRKGIDPGNLKKGVRQSVKRTAPGVITGEVRSTAPHAHLWEYGTVNRKTKQDWNRGRSPSHTRIGLSGIAWRMRRRMYRRVIEVLRTTGFEVTGE